MTFVDSLSLTATATDRIVNSENEWMIWGFLSEMSSISFEKYFEDKTVPFYGKDILGSLLCEGWEDVIEHRVRHTESTEWGGEVRDAVESTLVSGGANLPDMFSRML
ncbi:hypothetical protein BLNAU_5456 [Blattamonas nauphoetae]|uniref:Uncharacterized protein n=1 Tax=Blattamonas nauphoetae TaxID=2049346 RepID=A0ABQ9Y7M5_9EUKA|nr:hypothetical protein BLNAU_5456 [Blattamonas nauphoetae]